MTLGEWQDASTISGMTYSIQNADWRDYTRLNYLERICFRSEDIWSFWDLIGILTLPGFVRLKAVSDEHMVGFIGGERESVQRRGWITTLAVLPAYRRQGIALALLTECEFQLGMPFIRLSVRAANRPATRLYETAGYVLVDRWEKYYADGETALVFEKRR